MLNIDPRKSAGNYAWREDRYDRVGWRLGEKAEAGASSGTHAVMNRWVPAGACRRPSEHEAGTRRGTLKAKTRLNYRIETKIVSSEDEG